MHCCSRRKNYAGVPLSIEKRAAGGPLLNADWVKHILVTMDNTKSYMNQDLFQFVYV